MNPHAQQSTSLWVLARSLLQHRQLIVQMIKRDVIGRYKGSMMGLGWSFFNPLLMLAVYTFFFSVVFKSRWGGSDSNASFAIILFVGMIIHGLFAEIVNSAPSVILANVNYVKKVVFPLEILSLISVGSAIFHAMIGLVVLVIIQCVISQSLPWTAIFFPIILCPLILVALGFSWFLASLGVYARDVGQVTGLFTTILLFLSPVFYPMSALQPEYQVFLQMNPLTFIIEEGRKSLIFGVAPDWFGWCVAMMSGLVVMWSGFWWFQKTRKGFADVL